MAPASATPSWPEADFTGARLTGGVLFDARPGLDRMKSQTGRPLGVDLRDADISGAQGVATSFRGALLAGANLSGIDLSNADLRGVDLTGPI